MNNKTKCREMENSFKIIKNLNTKNFENSKIFKNAKFSKI